MFDLTLSFDNGPEPEATPAVLDVLARRNVKSTFFVIGDKLRDPQRHALAQRARAEGHWIGNHTLTHSTPLGLMDDAAAEHELTETQALLGGLAHPAKYFRPYGGGGLLDNRLLRRGVAKRLADEAYSCVLWNSVPGDWKDPEGWPDTAMAQCRERPWTLMVLHDLPTGAMAHLDRFVGMAVDAGARIVQGFPPGCVPVDRGRRMSTLEPFIADSDQGSERW